MDTKKILSIEKWILAGVAIMVLVGIFLFFFNRDAFMIYIEEDGFVEWLTVVGLLGGSFASFGRLGKLWGKRSWWFLFVTAGIAVFLFFAAGEEISWGQRIFHIHSSEFFIENNAQGETNLHNLVVDGVKLNKLIFSTLLSIFLVIYLVGFPILYNRFNGFRNFVDKSGIPIPYWYHSVSMLVLFALTEVIRHGKRAELLEAGTAFIFFLIILHPVNKQIFKK
ncbi:MAG: hypothetical protein QM727_13115 [Niabella sp.]